MNSVSHPSADQWTALYQGRLSRTAALTLKDHVLQCAECQATLGTHGLETLNRLTSGRSQQSSSTPPVKSDTALERLDPPPGADASDAPTLGPKSGPATPGLDLPPALANHPRYRVLRLLGQGGMGAVYEAEHRLMERRVALKVINPALMQDAAAVERFRLEVKAAARLAHPNIVTAYDAEQAENLHLLVMEYVEGISLAQVVQHQGRLDVPEACSAIAQAALGLEHAAERGMVHRDIKPHNLMRTAHGQIKILDFGLARFVREQGESVDGITAAGSFMGTPDFIAPEQARDARHADIRADIYSLGATFYYLLTGQVPFPGGSLIEKVMAHLEQTPTPITTLRSDVPPQVTAIVEHMLAKAPRDRFATPGEVAQALAPFIPSSTASWPARSSPAHPSTPTAILPAESALLRAKESSPQPIEAIDDGPHRKWMWWAGSAAAAVFLALLGALLGRYLLRGRSIDKQPLESASASAQPATADATIASPSRKALASAGPRPEELQKLLGHQGAVWCVAFSPDNRHALSASADQTIRVWDLQSAQTTQVLAGHQGGVRSAAFAPNGRQIVSGSADGTVRLWDVATVRQIRAFSDKGMGFVEAVAVSPDGRTALSAGRPNVKDGLVYLWNLETGALHRTLHVPRVMTWSVAFMPDGHAAVSAGGAPMREARAPGVTMHSVVLWDLDNGRLVRRYYGAEGIVRAVACSPDGRQIVGGAMDQTVRLWDVASGNQIRCFRGHTGPVTGVAFSADGKLALSGGDTTIRLWDIPSGRQVHAIEAHEPVLSIALSADGRQALSGSKDGGVSLWRLPEPDRSAVVKENRAGKLVLDSADREALVTIKHLGRVVAGPTANTQIDLEPGEYDIELTPWRQDLRLSTEHFQLIPGGEMVVFVRKVRLAPPSVPSESPRAPDVSHLHMLLQDDFHDPQSGFPHGRGKAGEHGYLQGKYIIHTTAPGAFGWNCPRGPYGHFICQVTGRSLRPSSTGWGLILANRELHRVIHINLSSDAQLRVSAGPGSSGLLPAGPIGPITNSAIKSGDDFNTLLLVLQGRTLTVYVNGVLVGKPVTLEQDLVPASIALAVFGGQHGGRAEFKEVKIWSTEGLKESQGAPVR